MYSVLTRLKDVENRVAGVTVGFRNGRDGIIDVKLNNKPVISVERSGENYKIFHNDDFSWARCDTPEQIFNWVLHKLK